jgi:pimeloyl-ACP methyl ester carboxylesterase
MSVSSFSFHPAAIEEAISAANWYRERSPWPQQDLSPNSIRAVDRILEAPHRWPRTARGTRKLKLPCFPFLVIYGELDGSIPILAVAHSYRRPGYWKSRS